MGASHSRPLLPEARMPTGAGYVLIECLCNNASETLSQARKGKEGWKSEREIKALTPSWRRSRDLARLLNIPRHVWPLVWPLVRSDDHHLCLSLNPRPPWRLAICRCTSAPQSRTMHSSSTVEALAPSVHENGTAQSFAMKDSNLRPTHTLTPSQSSTVTCTSTVNLVEKPNSSRSATGFPCFRRKQKHRRADPDDAGLPIHCKEPARARNFFMGWKLIFFGSCEWHLRT